MKKIYFLFCASLFLACDDGDIITEEFDFEDTSVSICPPALSLDVLDQVILYKNKIDTREALILSFTEGDEILSEEGVFTLPISGSNILEYRRFNSAPDTNYFCGIIPPNEPRVEEVFQALAGTINFTTTIIDDDRDGVPFELEFDGDTDGDTIPNYLDLDDDGDNVPTMDEISELNEDETDFIEIVDTDDDGTLNYLDSDDDGDLVLTRQETLDGDINPLNDLQDGVPNFLNEAVSEAASPAIDSDVRIPHTFVRRFEIAITITDLVLSNGNEEFIFETFNFGTYVQENLVTIQFN